MVDAFGMAFWSTVARPLEARWQAVLDGVAKSQRLTPSTEVAKLGAEVERLSSLYNGASGEVAPGHGALLSARLGFSFVRDVPKSSVAVAELIARGLLALDESRPLKVLDVGAGLGATTWGVVRALDAAGFSGVVEATFVDADERALAVASAIAKAAGGEGRVKLSMRTIAGETGAAPLSRHHDLVLFGQVLSELSPDATAAERLEAHTTLLERASSDGLFAGGSAVVVEPALRERTRHLMALRDRLASRVFAPCPHRAACPMLPRERDWCHEDVAIDLPPWLVPVARAAGLRFEGLTFSYLVLRRDGARLVDGASRVVARPKVTKGKREIDLCRADGGLLRAYRIDRDEAAPNEAFDVLDRGDLVRIEPDVDPKKPRVGRESVVTVEGPSATGLRGEPSAARVVG